MATSKVKLSGRKMFFPDGEEYGVKLLIHWIYHRAFDMKNTKDILLLIDAWLPADKYTMVMAENEIVDTIRKFHEHVIIDSGVVEKSGIPIGGQRWEPTLQNASPASVHGMYASGQEIVKSIITNERCATHEIALRQRTTVADGARRIRGLNTRDGRIIWPKWPILNAIVIYT